MPTCALRSCKSRYGQRPAAELSLFSFPPEIDPTRELWIHFVQKERREKKWKPSSTSKLCSKHFRQNDIHIGSTGRKSLARGSVPNIFLSEDETNSDDKSPTNPIKVEGSDSESIHDTPTYTALKAQVAKLKEEKVRHLAKIRHLNQQNRYFKRKILGLRDVVHNLKKKLYIKKKVLIKDC